MRPPTRFLLVLPLVALLLAACGATGSSPTASPPTTPSAPASDRSTPSPSPSMPTSEPPSASPSPSAPAEPSAPAIAVDGVVTTTVAGLRLREEPTTAATSLGTLPHSAPSYVVDGPVDADGYSWYLLSGLGIPQYSGCSGPLVTDPWECPVWFGWVAAGSPEGDAWLETTEPDCPTWPEIVTPEITFGVQRIAYLACFGDEELSLIGFYPEIPDDAGLGGACAEVPEELAWVGCNLGYEHINSDAPAPFGSGFVFSVDPTSVAMPDRGQWIRLAGRFDHPVADACDFGEPPAHSMLQCRAQFVVDAAEAVPAP